MIPIHTESLQPGGGVAPRVEVPPSPALWGVAPRVEVPPSPALWGVAPRLEVPPSPAFGGVAPRLEVPPSPACLDLFPHQRVGVIAHIHLEVERAAPNTRGPLLLLVHLLSCGQFFTTPWTALRQASLSFTISHSLLKLMSIESVMLSNHLILCRPLLLLPLVFPSFRVFSNALALHVTWPKYWSFSISPSCEYPRLISFKINWFNLLAVQGTLRSLLEHHSSKASILQCSAFFMVQLSHPHVTTGKPVDPGPLVS